MLQLYDTLTREKKPFGSLEAKRARIYSCGPTVYRDVHIGNLRTYLFADWLRRVLEAQGYDVYHVKNITDVGHMRQELLERGEDKVVAAALAAGKTPQQIARQYTESFLRDEAAPDSKPAHDLPRATDYIEQMRAQLQRLVGQGLGSFVEGAGYCSGARCQQ